MIKAYWTYQFHNFGDLLTPDVVQFFLGESVEHVPEETKGKLLAIGSIMEKIQDNDIVWGTGIHVFKNKEKKNDVKFLAVRGPKTRERIMTLYDEVPEVYGDPALLLPLMYKPDVQKQYRIGYVPHQVDVKVVKDIVRSLDLPDVVVIDPTNPDWKKTLDKILSCEKIISSSLHGIIVAEAYGIPAVWSVHSNKIFGGEFKYHDYFEATGRKDIRPFGYIPPIKNLDEIQKKLVNALKQHYGKI